MSGDHECRRASRKPAAVRSERCGEVEAGDPYLSMIERPGRVQRALTAAMPCRASNQEGGRKSNERPD
jgi:hypothetical protein